jgi:hypothetical protein
VCGLRKSVLLLEGALLLSAMNLREFLYVGGRSINVGDQVEVVGKRGAIVALVQPDTRDASDYACSTTGGILIRFEDGDLQLWPFVDEDLLFISSEEPSR